MDQRDCIFDLELRYRNCFVTVKDSTGFELRDNGMAGRAGTRRAAPVSFYYSLCSGSGDPASQSGALALRRRTWPSRIAEVRPRRPSHRHLASCPGAVQRCRWICHRGPDGVPSRRSTGWIIALALAHTPTQLRTPPRAAPVLSHAPPRGALKEIIANCLFGEPGRVAQMEF